MKTRTVSDELNDTDEYQHLERKRRELDIERDILRLLPGSLTVPTISNIDQKETDPTEPRAWLSFHKPYGDEAWNPADLLASLHSHNWRTRPASLVKWDEYRRSVDPGTVDELPEEHGSCFGRPYKFTDAEAIAPLWVVPEQHTGPDALCYLIGPDGKTYRVSVDLPHVVASVSARRKENMGGWRYERGTATLRHPDKWHAIQIDGQTVASKSARSFAAVDTEQGLSGAIYWQLDAHEQRDFPLSAGEMLAILLA